MDYKKIFRSREMRIRLMQALSFLPDPFTVRLQYKLKTGRTLHLKDPRRYTEKLQCYKLWYKDPLMAECVDKYNVRAFVARMGLESLLNDCYGVYERVEDIDFDVLPQKFVCKDTLGGGSTSVVVVDKSTWDREQLLRQMQKWLDESVKLKHPGREWPYDGQKHRIIIERYLEQSNGDLADYKFYCFGGKTACFYIRTDYAKSHEQGKMAFFDREQKLLRGVGMDYCACSDEAPPLPKELGEMIGCAEKLAAGFPHVRVDFYNVDGRIIFGEMTFYNASGYMSFTPDEFDYRLGALFELPKREGTVSE